MAYISVNEILLRANQLMADPLWSGWSRAELLNYYHEALLVILERRPDANAVNHEHVCSAGVKQQLPETALTLIDVTSSQSGSAVQLTTREILDQNYPDWYSGNSATIPQAYAYDPRNPRFFYVYPGVIAGSLISLIYAGIPDLITLSAVEDASHPADFPLRPQFIAPIIEYILYRAFSKDSDYVANANRAAAHMQAFNALIAPQSGTGS